jgi:hypothetical protein
MRFDNKIQELEQYLKDNPPLTYFDGREVVVVKTLRYAGVELVLDILKDEKK